MVSSLRVQLVEDIKQIIDSLHYAYIDLKYEIYKDAVLERILFLLEKYSRLLEMSPSLKILFNLCFDRTKSKLVFHAKSLLLNIDAVKTQMLEMIGANEGEHIFNISNAVNCIIGHSNRYIDDMKIYHNLCIKFNEKMVQLMAYPEHFREFFKDNFVGENNSVDVTEYKLTTRNVNCIETSTYCIECNAIWIMENSQGHTIVVNVSLDKLKYKCKDFITVEV